MSASARALIPHAHVEQLREARSILRTEGKALLKLADRLDENFCRAVEQIRLCEGTVIVTGMGKAGLIGRKVAATFSSTGTRARFLHPAEAVHGDLGCVDSHDLVLAFSNSGETEELCRLLPLFLRWDIPVIAVTAHSGSTLGSAATIVLSLGKLPEAGPLGLAPTTSTTSMLALGDALALVVSRLKGFTPHDFALYHPAGSLGARLKTVQDLMRRGEELRIAGERESVRQVFIAAGKPGRRTGAVMLVDDDGRLSGLFTDSDLARLLERRCDDLLDAPICTVMTRHPVTVRPEQMLDSILDLLSERKLSELPVVDADHRPVGLIDITDVISYIPHLSERIKPEPATSKSAIG